ncbi:Serine/threonine protein kinase [Enhygromyxa salina]|uniref:Serine/threonine protein kinase n=1 Tax=Enhygromyxa salina TaxID=215803 RepID=A0A0C1Z709_9BACT|nr:cyclic nucleotide-binding domain-containing protein [Enhygromyxa salina]KIG13424.1 Serine/threonine protein kinase [Enhygromyxa salina]
MTANKTESDHIKQALGNNKTVAEPRSPAPKLLDYDASMIEQLLRSTLPANSERLELRREVGRGGMGSVWLAIDRSLRRPVALKQLDDSFATNMSQVANFLREARVTAQIDHPNLVPVYEVGVRDGHRIYYTMKLVEGEDLAVRVRSKPLEERSQTELLDQIDSVIRICGAVAAAHDFGYVHCDIKPHNIMIGRYGAAYLMDWGLVQPLRRDSVIRSSSYSEAQEVSGTEPKWISDANLVSGGTPAFMAPEQARDAPITAQTDVFALGSVLYFILTARGPFTNRSRDEALRRAKACDFERPSALREDIPPALEAIVLKAMAEQPCDRYSTVEALATALTRYLRGGGWEFQSVSIAAGDVVVRQGEFADAAYIIVTGRCEVTREEHGEQRVLRVMEAGEVFGETAILAGSPRTATVRALTDVTLYAITGEVFEREVGRWNPWVAQFVQTLARRLGEDR